MSPETRPRYLFHKVSKSDTRAFVSIAGQANVITGQEKLADYSCDEAPLVKPIFPQVVVRPLDSITVSSILKYANIRRIPVTSRGAGTGLSGGCIPSFGGVVLSLENMNRIIEVDRQNFTATIEPGVSLGKLREHLGPLGLGYPVSLGEMSATVGGSTATNAGGLNAVKYGVTRHHVLGLQAVLAGGEIIRTGGKFVKCSSGYDLTQLLVGSEGTLAVITEITLKLDTKSTCREALFIPFSSLQDAIDSVPDILMLGKMPAGLEFMESSIMQIAEEYTGRKLPHHGYGAFLLILSEAATQDEITGYFNEVEQIVKKHGAADALVPPGQQAMRRLLEARENFYHYIKKYAPMQILDAVVPRSEIARFVLGVKEMEARYGFPIIIYGHAGDGNVHLHPVCRGMSLNSWKKKLNVLMQDIYLLSAKYGGAVSGEHGIGIDKKEYFYATADRDLLDTMKKIKTALDPNGILNPGKIFD
ncbi:MAG: FAD-binding protein [Dehalococcoidia bacterium]|nr:FAD-binding protein [Dehalococcoidia bacterium]